MPGSFSVVGAQCEGQSCQVGASNGVLATRAGNLKYLTVNYVASLPERRGGAKEIKEQLLDPFKGPDFSTGCSPLSKCGFSTGETFSDRVGAKIITSPWTLISMGQGMEMTEVYCGTFAVDFTPADDEEFGFYCTTSWIQRTSYRPYQHWMRRRPCSEVSGRYHFSDGFLHARVRMGRKSRSRFSEGDELYTWGSCARLRRRACELPF